MIKITIPETELYDSNTSSFIRTTPTVVTLEHSLASMSKWESKWELPFFGTAEKTKEQVLDYTRLMVIGEEIDPNVFSGLTAENVRVIKDYIESKQTATWFSSEQRGPHSRKIITTEVIYSWMISQGIPFECQYWHINRLLTLIRVISESQEKPKKMRKSSVMSQNRMLNAQRRARLGSSG